MAVDPVEKERKERRGGLLRSLHEKVNPDHTAILVVDMQNDFCSEGGFLSQLGVDLSNVGRIIPEIQRLLNRARASNIPVIHIRSHFDPEYLLPPMLERLERKNSPPYCIQGTWGAEFVPGLAPEDADIVITKHRYSGFFATDLDMRLRARGIRTVILTGTATNNCVDGTGRDAFYEGYYVVLLSDATTAPTAELHDAALQTADHAYAVVHTVEDVTKQWP